MRTLIQFFVDIEIMGREFDGARMFYSKFAYRHYMAELLLYVTKHDSYIKSLELVVSAKDVQDPALCDLVHVWSIAVVRLLLAAGLERTAATLDRAD